MYFNTKSYLKNIRNHTAKHDLSQQFTWATSAQLG